MVLRRPSGAIRAHFLVSFAWILCWLSLGRVLVSVTLCPVADFSTPPRFPNFGLGPFLSEPACTKFFCLCRPTVNFIRYMHPTTNPPPLPGLGTGTGFFRFLRRAYTVWEKTAERSFQNSLSKRHPFSAGSFCVCVMWRRLFVFVSPSLHVSVFFYLCGRPSFSTCPTLSVCL